MALPLTHTTTIYRPSKSSTTNLPPELVNERELLICRI